MDKKMLARLALAIVIAVALMAEAVHRAREDLSAASRPSLATDMEAPRSNPMRGRLLRCQQMGESASRDPECLAAWDENRRRFLSPTAGD